MARRVLDDDEDHPAYKVYKCSDCSPSGSDCSQECTLIIPASPPPPAVKYHMPAYFIFMLCLLGALFVVLCYVTILKRRNSRRRTTASPPPVEESRRDFIDGEQTQQVDHPIWYIRTVGLPDAVIESISVFKYKGGEGLTEGTDCSVCLTEFQEDERLRLLPKCSHAFHVPCIDTWLRSHKNCPLCRAPIISETTNVVDVEQADNVVALADQETTTHQENEEVNPEIRPPIEARNHKGIRAQSDLAEHRVVVDDENENFQPPRRSVSMDSSSASMIRLSAAEIEAAKMNFEIGSSKPSSSSSSSSASRSSRWYSAMKSSSFGRSLQKVPIGMKRSSSTSSGNCSLPTTNSRSQGF